MAAADTPRPGRNYDDGKAQAEAFAAVLDRWNPLDPQSGQRPLSNSTVAGRITRHLGRTYWPTDVQRTYQGHARLRHLQPQVVEAYCVALDRTDPDGLAEAFSAIELKPPGVTREALKLAIATSRAGRPGRLSA